MRRAFIRIIILPLTFILIYSDAYAKNNSDTIADLKNTVRINITNPMIFGDEFRVMGYERVLTKTQSLSVSFGQFSLPKFVDGISDSLELKWGYTDRGLNFSVDYRFYLGHENKYPAPRGIYIGPYYAFNFLERTNTWSLNSSDYTGDVISKVRLNANLIGAQMGYQFVIKKRLAVDIILMGPGVWFYSVKSTLDTTLDPEQEALIFEKINELLAEKLPGNEVLIKPSDDFRQGRVFQSSVGFRYIINLGFRF